MNSLATLRRSVLAALRPSGAPWAVGPALWAVGTAALIAGTGAIIGELQLVGLAYLGAACAVVFLHSGFYRARWWAWVAQAFGGAAGISVGALLLPGNAVAQTVTAAVFGAISGMVGGIAPSAPAFGLMLSVGLAFGQFGGSSLPWWQQAVCYLAGTSVAAMSVLAPWAFHRDKPERPTRPARPATGWRRHRPSREPPAIAAAPIGWRSRRPPSTPRAGSFRRRPSRRSDRPGSRSRRRRR
jgi:hypothetical protein